MIRSIFILCLVTISGTLKAESLGPDYGVVQQWTAADGLPADTISRLAIDEQGYLWMATYDGIVRHQGFDFRVYTRETEPAFPNNRAFAVFAAPESGVIVHFENGALGYLGSHGYQPIGHSEISNVAVWNELIWFIDQQTQRLYSWSNSGGLQPRTSTILTKLAVDRFNERLLLGGVNGGVQAMSLTNEGLVGYTQIISTTPDPVIGVAGGPNEATLILTSRSAHQVSSGSETLQTTHLTNWENTQPRLLRAAWTADGWHIANLFTDSGVGPTTLLTSGARALPVDAVRSVDADRSAATIVRIDARERRWINDGHRLFRDGELIYTSKNRIFDFIVDSFDQIWMAQPGQGLKLLKRSMIRIIGQGPAGLPDPNITMVTQIEGDILAGGWVALSKLDPETGEWQHLLDRAARDVIPDGDGLLVGNNGVCRLSGPGKCLPAVDFPLPTADVPLLHRDSTGAVWAGTEAGIFRRSPDGAWQRRLIHPSAARAALENQHGELVLGTNGDGLLVLSIHDGPAFPVTQLGREAGLSSQFIRSLLSVSNGRILVGTEDAGMCLLNSDMDMVGCISTADGLPHHSVHFMLVDELHRLWVNTNSGIYSVDLTNLLTYIEGGHSSVPVFRQFGERQGLLSLEGNGGVNRAGVYTADGRIWLPNQKGLVIIQTHSDSTTALPTLKPLIRVQGETVNEPLELDATARQLELEVLAIALTRPEDVEFRYRFGRSEDWFMLGKQRRMTLTNLPPGPQRIEFQARYPELEWRGPATMLELHVGYLTHEHPATKTVLLLLALTGLSGIWLLMRNRQRALERKVKERSLRLDQASQQVTKLNDSMQRVDLRHRTALKAVSGELKAVLDAAIEPLLDRMDPPPSKKELGEIQSKARTLGRLVDQVNEFGDGSSHSVETKPDPSPNAGLNQSENESKSTRYRTDDTSDLENRVRLEVLLNLSDPEFTVDKLAATMAMSRSVLYRRVAEFSDSSPAELIRDLRLEQAGRLLLETEERISTIGDATGFRDVSTFSRAFSKKMGMSPRQWRKQQARDSSALKE